jgi:hypothetical protein
MPARPPHFFPTSVTIAKRPSCGEETGRGRKGDLPDEKSEKFFARGLDDPNHIELVQEIAIQAHVNAGSERTVEWRMLEPNPAAGAAAWSRHGAAFVPGAGGDG